MYMLSIMIIFMPFMETQIIDAVVVSYILKATLVVPKLDQQSFWNDSRFAF